MPEVSGNPRNFTCTLPTQVDRATFWKVWTDVEAWPTWDSPLAEASLEAWQLGAKGKLKTKSGQSSRFVVSELEPQSSYAFVTQLPGASLVVRRYFSEVKGQLHFTHNISFDGPLSVIFAQLLGRGFMRDLPAIMEALERVARSHVSLAKG